MEQFIKDVWEEFGKYYDTLVEWVPGILFGLTVFVLVMLMARLIRRVLGKYLKKRTEDLLIAQFIVRMIYILMIIIGIVIALDAGGMNGAASKLLAGAGVSAVILGFAFKDIGENFLAGIFLAFKRPFRIGDLVDVQDIKGRITGLNLRETLVKTLDGKDVFIPNSIIIKNPIINYTLDGYFRDSFIVGLDYGENASTAIDIIYKTIQGLNNGLGTGKDPQIVVKDLGSSTLNLEVHFWLVTDKPEFNIPGLRTMVVTEVLEALNKEGLYMPASIVEIKNYKDGLWQTKELLDQAQAS